MIELNDEDCPSAMLRCGRLKIWSTVQGCRGHRRRIYSRRFDERSLKNTVTCSIQVSFYSSGSTRCNTRSGINADLISIASHRRISNCHLLARTLKFAWLSVMRSVCFDKIRSHIRNERDDHQLLLSSKFLELLKF